MASSQQRSYVDVVATEAPCYTFQEVDTSDEEEEHQEQTQKGEQQDRVCAELINTTIPFTTALENDNGASSSCASCSDDDDTEDEFYGVGNTRMQNELVNRQVQPLLPDHISLHTLRRVVREQWSRLVIRKIRTVKSEVDTKSSLLKFIDAPLKKKTMSWEAPLFKSGEVIIYHDSTLEQADFRYDCSKCAATVTLPVTKWYYGFVEMERENTDNRVRMANKFLPVPPTVSPNQFIYFNCRNARGFDMSLTSYAWFAMTPSNDLLHKMPPPIGAYIAGTVKYNKRGAFFDRWFYPSEEFLNLYHLVMGEEAANAEFQVPSCEEIVKHKEQLDCSWMWFWQLKDYVKDDEFLVKENIAAKSPLEVVGRAAELRAPFSMEKRMDIMKTQNTHLFDASTAHEPLGLYYFYQMFCVGRVIDWEHTWHRTLEQTTNCRLRHAVCYHYRKSLKRRFRTAHNLKQCKSSGEPDDTCKHVTVRNVGGLVLFCTIRQQQRQARETVVDESSCAVTCMPTRNANQGVATAKSSEPTPALSDISDFATCNDWGKLAAEIDQVREQQSASAKDETAEKKKKKNQAAKKRLT